MLTPTPTKSPTLTRVRIAGGAAVALVAAGAAWAGFGGGEGSEHPVVRMDPVPHEVIYEVAGTGSAPVVTWVVGERNASEHALEVPLPWTRTVTLPVGPAGGFANVEVRSPGSGAGTLGCRVFVDGVQVAQQVSTDGFAGVSCSYRIPAEYVK